MIHDDRVCELGEGAFWHPTRKQFFWFDIVNRKLLTQEDGRPKRWLFDQMVSAMAWVDDDVLLIAGEEDIFLFDLETEGKRT